ncbi:MAG: Sec-independent protein translocase protein TatB [Acidiferrobacterales bacterium]|nr:Sec-independent protein translocase protein TatB [Acidiferrobacterales bacterium]
MFDIGFWEIAIIALIALLILGPERLPRAARSVGLWVGKARRTLAEVKRDIDRELDASELKELKSIKKDLEETKSVIDKDMAETKAVFDEAATSLDEEIAEASETVAVKADFINPEPVVTEEDAGVGDEIKSTG